MASRLLEEVRYEYSFPMFENSANSNPLQQFNFLLSQMYKTGKYHRVHGTLLFPQNLAFVGEHIQPHYVVKFGKAFEACPKIFFRGDHALPLVLLLLLLPYDI